MKETKLLIIHRRGWFRPAHRYWESAKDWASYGVNENGTLKVIRPDGRKVQYAPGTWTQVETRWVS